MDGAIALHLDTPPQKIHIWQRTNSIKFVASQVSSEEDVCISRNNALCRWGGCLALSTEDQSKVTGKN